MKKYAVLIYTDEALLEALPEGRFEESMRGCITHADELRSKGTLTDAQMLEGREKARSIRVRNGRRTITDGPFAETKEMLAGFNMIEARDMDEAVRIACEFPWAETGCIEVREVMERQSMRDRVFAAEQATPRA